MKNGSQKGREKRNALREAARTCFQSAGTVLFWCLWALVVGLASRSIENRLFPAPQEAAAEAAAKPGAEPESVAEPGLPQEAAAKPVAEPGLPQEAAAKPAAEPGLSQEAAEQKTVALTFDDGPHPVYTERLLDGLKERGVCATFFVIGKNIPGNEALIARMEEEGHLIGNHTYDHVKICGMDPEEACRQIEQTSDLVREITGHDTEFVRPPFGAWDPGLECRFKMIPVLWDVDPLDWTTSDVSLVVQRVVSEVEDQDIILLHDFYESSVEAALEIVDILEKEGFRFVRADELILG